MPHPNILPVLRDMLLDRLLRGGTAPATPSNPKFALYDDVHHPISGYVSGGSAFAEELVSATYAGGWLSSGAGRTNTAAASLGTAGALISDARYTALIADNLPDGTAGTKVPWLAWDTGLTDIPSGEAVIIPSGALIFRISGIEDAFFKADWWADLLRKIMPHATTGAGTFPVPATWQAGLYSGHPLAGGTELASIYNYARATIANSAAVWSRTDGVILNLGTWDFGTASQPWQPFNHVALHDPATPAVPLIVFPLAAPRSVYTNQPGKIYPGELRISFDLWEDESA